ncbi:hypothetical protein CEW46_23975, partial [Bacillus cereus]
CESPITDEKPCYNCTPCRTHMGALFQLGLDGEEWAKDELQNHISARNSKSTPTLIEEEKEVVTKN